VKPEEVRDLLPLYALDALSKPERAQVEEALERYPDLRAELRALQDTTSELFLALPPHPLPKGLEERVMQKIRPSRLVMPRWLMPAVAVAAFVLLVWVGSWSYIWVTALGDPDSRLITLVDAQGTLVGRALVRQDRQTLMVANLPPLANGKVYQAWGIGTGNPIPLNTFTRRVVVLSLPVAAQALAISEEPRGGSQSPSKILALPKS